MSRRYKFFAPLVIVGFLHAPRCHAQSPTPHPAFEVASIRPNNSTDFRLQMQSLQGGTLVVKNAPLKLIITRAFGLPLQSSQRLSGGPDWMNSEKFDIEAKAEGGAVPGDLSGKARDDRLMLMLQALLAERFRLTTHWETRQLPVYALVVSKNGPKVQGAKIEEKACPDSANLIAPAPGTVYCHAIFGGQGRGIHGKTISMSELATWLENWTDRPVVNNTGYKALFDLDTEGWAPANSGPSAAPDAAATNLAGEQSLLSVLNDIGLKLEAAKGPVRLLVVDHVERPSAN